MRPRFFAVAALAALLTPAALAQPAAGAWLDTFAVPGVHLGDPVGGGIVYDVEPDGAGGYYVGGQFEVVDDARAYSVAHWTGSRWEALGGGLRRADGTRTSVYAVRASSSGVYVAGDFDTAVQPDGTELTVSGIARWTGTAWEALGQGLYIAWPSTLFGGALLVRDDGVYVAGNFAGGVSTGGTLVESPRFIRWDGSAWEALPRPPGTPTALIEGTEGSMLLVGGFFSMENPDGTFVQKAAVVQYTPGGAMWSLGGVHSLSGSSEAVAFDGGVLLGGGFSSIRLQDWTEVAARNVAYYRDGTWRPFGGGTNGAVHAVSVVGPDRYLVGGDFTEVIQSDGTSLSVGGLAAWSFADGWAPVADSLGNYHGELLSVHDVVGDAEVVAGRFYAASEAGGVVRQMKGLARRDGTAWRPLSTWSGAQALSSGTNVLAASPCDARAIIAAGGFRRAGQREAGGVAVWTGDGWLPAGRLAPDAFGNASSGVALAPTADCAGSTGAFYVGGDFPGVVNDDGTTVPSRNVAYWNGAAWQPLGRGTNGFVSALAADADGVYVGGWFTEVYQADGTPVAAPYLARWTPQGGWTPVGGGFVPVAAYPPATSVRTLLLDPVGRLYVGGAFDGVIGDDGTQHAALSLARWDGHAWTVVGGPAPIPFAFPLVDALALEGDALYVGGVFAAVADPGGPAIPAMNVAHFDTDGWHALADGLPQQVFDLTLDADGALYATGTYGEGAQLGSVVRWDGAVWLPLDRGLDAAGTYALAFDGEGRLFVGGSFEVAGGMGAAGLAVWDPAASVSNEPTETETLRPFALGAYPNPFTRSAVLTFELPAASPARLVVSDALGREVAVLADGPLAAGRHEARLETAGLPSGVYLVRLEAGGRSATRAVTLLR